MKFANENNVCAGDLLILAAQIITAVQMVYEEKYVKDLNIPALVAVGYEGNCQEFSKSAVYDGS